MKQGFRVRINNGASEHERLNPIDLEVGLELDGSFLFQRCFRMSPEQALELGQALVSHAREVRGDGSLLVKRLASHVWQVGPVRVTRVFGGDRDVFQARDGGTLELLCQGDMEYCLDRARDYARAKRKAE